MTKMIAELIEQRFGLPSTAGHDTPAEADGDPQPLNPPPLLPTCRFPKT
jgi:hypothetical protein